MNVQRPWFSRPRDAGVSSDADEPRGAQGRQEGTNLRPPRALSFGPREPAEVDCVHRLRAEPAHGTPTAVTTMLDAGPRVNAVTLRRMKWIGLPVVSATKEPSVCTPFAWPRSCVQFTPSNEASRSTVYEVGVPPVPFDANE